MYLASNNYAPAPLRCYSLYSAAPDRIGGFPTSGGVAFNSRALGMYIGAAR